MFLYLFLLFNNCPKWQSSDMYTNIPSVKPLFQWIVLLLNQTAGHQLSRLHVQQSEQITKTAKMYCSSSCAEQLMIMHHFGAQECMCYSHKCKQNNNLGALCFFSGGFAFVYEAQDMSSGKDYALKVRHRWTHWGHSTCCLIHVEPLSLCACSFFLSFIHSFTCTRHGNGMECK